MIDLPITQDMIDRAEADQSPEAKALREGGAPELKRQVELAMDELKAGAKPFPVRKRLTKLAMAVGFGLAYQRADSRVRG